MLNLLKLIALLGFVICAIIHVWTFLGIFRPPGFLMTSLNITFISLVLIRLLVISKRFRKDMDKKTFSEAVSNVAPAGLDQVNGIFIIYGILMLLWSLKNAYSLASGSHGNTDLAMNSCYKGFTSLLMAIFIVEFSLLYNYGRLAKKMKLSSEEGEWDILK